MKNLMSHLVLLSLLFVSCNKDDMGVSNSNSDFKNPKSLFAVMNMSLELDSTLSSIVIESFGNANDNNKSTKAHAAFFATPERNLKVNANNLYIDNHILQADADNEYFLSDNFLSSYGTNSIVSVEGSSYIDSINFQEYIPEDLIVTTQNTDTLDKNYDYTLNWNADNNNSYGVFIHVEYNGTINSTMIDSNLPDTTINWSANVPDNGSYTIASNVFSDMPLNGLVSIHIARGTASINGNNQKHLFVAGSLVVEMVEIK